MIGLSGFGIFQFCRRFLPAQPSKRLHETSLLSRPLVKHLHRATPCEALASCACTDLRASCCIPRYACKPLRLRSELSWWRCRKITRARCLGRFRSSCLAGAKVTDKLFEMADRAMHDHCSFVSGALKDLFGRVGPFARNEGLQSCYCTWSSEGCIFVPGPARAIHMHAVDTVVCRTEVYCITELLFPSSSPGLA